jgi:hypothetical protein
MAASMSGQVHVGNTGCDRMSWVATGQVCRAAAAGVFTEVITVD